MMILRRRMESQGRAVMKLLLPFNIVFALETCSSAVEGCLVIWVQRTRMCLLANRYLLLLLVCDIVVRCAPCGCSIIAGDQLRIEQGHAQIRTYCFLLSELKLLSVGGGFGNKLQDDSGSVPLSRGACKLRYLCSCTPFQSVVQRVL